MCIMDRRDEPELHMGEVITRSDSDEWSENNDSKDFNDEDYVGDNSNSRFIDGINGIVKENVLNRGSTVFVSEYNVEQIKNNIETGHSQGSTIQNNEKELYHAHGKSKRKFVSMETKLEAIRKLDQGEKVRKVAMELGVGQVTVGDWRRNRARIEKWCMEKCSEDASSSRKTMKRSDFEKTSEALFLWFSQERLKGIPVSGPMLQEKALYFHKQFQDGDGSFTASVGWLDRWKKRYGIRRLTMCGEKLSLDLEAVETFQNKLHSLIKDGNLTADQLYNCDETGLKYKTLPSLSRLEIPDYQKSKDRVSVLTCCNASGQHKLPLMLVGKACYLESLKNVPSGELPVSYKVNKSSLIDCDIFKEWFFKEFVPNTEKFLKEKNLPIKAVLILDSGSSHPNEEELISGSIQTLFLPPTYTSLLQPMNQGILSSFKINFRLNLFQFLIRNKQEGEKDSIVNCMKTMNLIDIVNHMSEAWMHLQSDILIRAWEKLLTSSENIDEVEDTQGKTNLITLIRLIPGLEFADENTLQQWFELDDSYEVVGSSLAESADCESGGENETLKTEKYGVKQNKAYHAKGLSALSIASLYIQQQEEATTEDILFLEKWKHFAEKKLSQFQK